jgi:hypothetical protein
MGCDHAWAANMQCSGGCATWREALIALHYPTITHELSLQAAQMTAFTLGSQGREAGLFTFVVLSCEKAMDW